MTLAETREEIIAGLTREVEGMVARGETEGYHVNVISSLRRMAEALEKRTEAGDAEILKIIHEPMPNPDPEGAARLTAQIEAMLAQERAGSVSTAREAYARQIERAAEMVAEDYARTLRTTARMIRRNGRGDDSAARAFLAEAPEIPGHPFFDAATSNATATEWFDRMLRTEAMDRVVSSLSGAIHVLDGWLRITAFQEWFDATKGAGVRT